MGSSLIESYHWECLRLILRERRRIGAGRSLGPTLLEDGGIASTFTDIFASARPKITDD
jgi:hypothetical protein